MIYSVSRYEKERRYGCAILDSFNLASGMKKRVLVLNAAYPYSRRVVSIPCMRGGRCSYC